MIEHITNPDIINFLWGTIQNIVQSGLYDGVKTILGKKFEQLLHYKSKDDIARFSSLLEAELEKNATLTTEIEKLMLDKSRIYSKTEVNITGDVNSNGGSISIGNITHG